MPYITLRRYFATALKASRIDSFRFHDLRHTFASHFAMRTGDLPTLQQLLGHASIQMTLRYAHLSDTHMAEKMALLSMSMPIENRTISPHHCTTDCTNPDYNTPKYCRIVNEIADLAQLVEQLFCKQQVIGSNPIVG